MKESQPLSNRDVDAIVQMQYEDALADEEPWAVESYEYRVVKSAVTADAGCLAGFSGESPQPISDHHDEGREGPDAD